MSEDKKIYYQEYHQRTYKKLKKACQTCGIVSELGRKKYCNECKKKISSICIDCNREVFYKAKVQRCTTCQYHWYKNNHQERFEEVRVERAKRYNKKLRQRNGLPEDYDFEIAPRGSGYLNKKGYLLLVIKLEKGKYLRKYEHVMIMERNLGRDLIKGETVHHKNGIRNDNRIDNLELWSRGQPAGQRVEDKIKFYIEFLEQYGYKVIKE